MNLNLGNELMQEVFANLANEVYLLDPLRDSSNEIIDFKILTGKHEENSNAASLDGVSATWKKGAELFDHFRRVAETGQPFEVVFRTRERPVEQWYHVRAMKFNGGLIVYQQDVSRAKQAEEKIMQLNRALFSKNRELEALSSELKTFNSIAANDYNETLKNLYNSMEFIISNDAKNLSDAGRANIRRAQAAIQKMKLLTEDIIAFSKVQSEDEMGQVDLNEIMQLVRLSLDEKIRTENALIRTDHLPVIHGYAPLVSLLFHHLIRNAIKFRKNDSDPVVDITYTFNAGAEIEHSSAIPEVSYHVISVVDNGIGFDPQEGEKIFTMFYRLHERGKQKGGIGLAICKKIMDLHGGFIASECTPECTTFKCYFPMQKL